MIPPQHFLTTKISRILSESLDTVGIGTEMVGGVDLAPASSRRDDTRGRGTGRLTAGLDGLFTSVAVGLAGKTRQRFGLLGAHARWRHGVGWSRPSRRPVAWPHDMQHAAQPQQSQPHQLVEDMGATRVLPPLHRR
jgi:hypothetical protein